MHCALNTTVPGGILIAGAYAPTRSLRHHFDKEDCDQGGHSGMHDSIPAGISAADPAGRILQDLCSTS